MVKGNWERRAELATKKRQEAKERKALKKSGAVVNPESCANKLAADVVLRARGARIEVYVRDDAGGGSVVCRHHFRRADCAVKRCRLLHDERCTLSHVRNVRRDPDSSDGRGTGNGIGDGAVAAAVGSVPEPRCLPPQPLLEALPLPDWTALLFVTVDDECVFDHAAPDVWNEWIAQHRAGAAAAGAVGTLPTVKEDDDDDDDGGDGDDDSDNGEEGRHKDGDGDCSAGCVHGEGQTPVRPAPDGGRARPRSFFCGEAGLVARCPPAMTLLFAFAAVKDVGAAMQCCKAMKTCALRDESFRQRRREALALVASKLSKQKKDDKKKKAKNANVKKTDKKDGFARGGPGR